MCITYLIIDLCPILSLIAILQSQKSCRLFLQLAIKYIIYTSADHLPWDTQLSHHDHIRCLLAQNRKGSLISRGCLIWRDTGLLPAYIWLRVAVPFSKVVRLCRITCVRYMVRFGMGTGWYMARVGKNVGYELVVGTGRPASYYIAIGLVELWKMRISIFFKRHNTFMLPIFHCRHIQMNFWQHFIVFTGVERCHARSTSEMKGYYSRAL